MNSSPDGKKIGLGPRTASWLRGEYVKDATKRIAADFRVSVGTAKLWLAGHAPATWHLEEMAARWGGRFIKHAFQDAVHAAEEWALRRRNEALTKQMEKQAHALDSEGPAARRGVAAVGRALARRLKFRRSAV